MAVTSNSKPARSSNTRRSSADFLTDHDDWDQQPETKRDWKKVALIFGLGSLSWVATYVGMLELIQANMGDLPIVQKAIIGFAVAMLMTMIIWLLDQLFASHNLFTKLSYVAGYMFLTLISVGFGFGFYWKVLESRSEATRSAESAISQVQTSLHGAGTRLSQLQTTLEGLAIISKQKAVEERTQGTSCPNSSPGDGPRRKLRDADAARFEFSSNFVKTRVGTAKTNMQALNADMQKVVKGARSTFDAKTGTRNEFMRALNRKLNLTVTGFNAFRTDPQLKQIRTDLAERAGRTSFPDGRGGTFSCPDVQLQAALRGVVRAIDQLPELQKPKIAAVEGSEAVIEAFRRLTATMFGAMQFKLPPSPEELRQLQQKAVQSVSASRRGPTSADMQGAGLSKRDYIPLAIAIFVDLCLLLVSMGRTTNRLDNLVPKMRRAERGPVIQILSRFNEIHKDPEVRENFEIFRHVVFDWGGDYYVAVPLNAPYTANQNLGGGQYQRVNNQVEELQQEAHLLANLFSSFEQEKIFSRVLVPLLSTKAIQKKLHRQGSKFAGSESFRVYKFRDGAWSEIILGAVMGAARRVEANKRRRRIEEDVFDSAEPAFDVNQAQGVADEDGRLAAIGRGDDDIISAQPEDALRQMAEIGARIARLENAAQSESGQHIAGDPIDVSRPATQYPQPQTGAQTAAPNYWTTPAATSAPAAPVADAANVARFGPYGSAATAELTGKAAWEAGGIGPDAPAPAFGAAGTGANRDSRADQLAASPAANNNTAPIAERQVANSAAQDALANDTASIDAGNGAANVIRLPSAQIQATTQPVAAPASVTPAQALATEVPASVERSIEISTVSSAPGTPVNGTAAPTPVVTDVATSLDGMLQTAFVNPDPQSINVELRERSLTYTIPAHDASLPAHLLANAPSSPTLATALASLPAIEDGAQSELTFELADDAQKTSADATVPATGIEIEVLGLASPEEENRQSAPRSDNEGLTIVTPEAVAAVAFGEGASDKKDQGSITSSGSPGRYDIGRWNDVGREIGSQEASVEINTSEISCRFAHSAKKD